MKKNDQQWIVCQIGGREHYAIPRALQSVGALKHLLTDFWVLPGALMGKIPRGRRLQDRWHRELANASVTAPNARMLAFEFQSKLTKKVGWPLILERNALFQRQAINILSRIIDHGSSITLFSYSYAARDLFRFAKDRGWKTVLGQIDPGPEEERIVAFEHQRYPNLASGWEKAPSSYWDEWREEVELADRIIINSEWSRECLLKEGISGDKLEIIPLVYSVNESAPEIKRMRKKEEPLRVLFLGQINLRKGIGRLLDAMSLLRGEMIELILAGPTEVDPSAWANLSSVTWVGSVPRSEVGKYYAEADLFILPTLSDGYALTQLEALARGLPVMASQHCGAAVIHGENGVILDGLEPSQIAEALMKYADGNTHSRLLTLPSFGLSELALKLIGAI